VDKLKHRQLVFFTIDAYNKEQRSIASVDELVLEVLDKGAVGLFALKALSDNFSL
jgi:hypothetical protein